VERVRTQAKDLFPTVYLTLISIIQALALETLWSDLVQLDHIWTWNITAVIGWLQIGAVFELIFIVWLTYAHTIMQVRWVVSVRDSMIPFALGLVEFALAALIHPDKVHMWCYTLALGSVIGTWASIATRRAARSESDNADLIRALGLSRPVQEHRLYIAAGALGLLAGLLVGWHGGSGWVALSVVALVNLGLIVLIVMEAAFWRRSIADTG
jgi:hypothetical protein